MPEVSTWVETGKKQMQAIVDQIMAAGYGKIDGAIICGDYATKNNNAEYSQTGIVVVNDVLSEAWGLNYDNTIYVQGNHEPDVYSDTANLDTPGANDAAEYGVYVLHEQDFLSAQGTDGAKSSATVQAAADALERYLSEKVEAKYAKPIFIASHVPLHYSSRTFLKNGDNYYSKYIFDVLNKYGEQLNIIFLFGHNHSKTCDDYIGGSAIYLPVGETIKIPKEGSTTEYFEEELTFSYINGGYLGFTHTECETGLSSTVFTIYEDEVVVERYDADGLANMKDKGILDTTPEEGEEDPIWDYWTGAEADESVHTSPVLSR